MTAKHSFADVKSDLETMLGAERVQQVGATRVDDHARIASLLTDEDACRVYLARLNSELVTRCRARNMIGKFFGFERKSLTTTRYQHPAKPDETAEVVKHNKVFTDFFRQWEDAAGFNQGVQQIEGGMPLAPKTINLPGRAATRRSPSSWSPMTFASTCSSMATTGRMPASAAGTASSRTASTGTSSSNTHVPIRTG